MTIKLRKVYRELMEYKPVLYSKTDGEEVLMDVQLLPINTEAIHEKILYITKASQINNMEKYKLKKGVYIIEADTDYELDWFLDNDISFIEVSSNKGIEKLFSKIKSLFIEDYVILESSAILLNALTKDRGLNYIINISSKLLKNPIILVDSSFKILAHSDIEYITEPFWIRNINLGYCSYEFISEVNKIKSFKNAPNSIDPFLVMCKESPIKKLVSKVLIDGNLVGYVVILENIEKFTNTTYEIIKILSNVISEELKKDQVYRNLHGLRYENLLIDILEESIIDETALEERMKSINCSFGNKLCLLVLDISKYNLKENKSNFLKQSIETLFLNYKSIFYKEHVLIILDLDDEKKLEDIIDKDVISFLQKHDIVLVISNFFSHILDLNKHYKQAMKSINIIHMLEINGNIFHHDDLIFYHLLKDMSEDFELMDYCSQSVYKLLEYDMKNNTKYYLTLKTYIEEDKNAIKTADKLFVHRNTINYRLNKIKEIMDVDLDNGDELFIISMSINILEFLNKKEKIGLKRRK